MKNRRLKNMKSKLFAAIVLGELSAGYLIGRIEYRSSLALFRLLL